MCSAARTWCRGGSREEARGILETKREIKDLRERIATTATRWSAWPRKPPASRRTIAQASTAIAALNAEHHRQEKAIVGLDAQLQHAAEEAARLAQKGEQLARERRQAEEERDALDRRQEEARASIARLERRPAARRRAADRWPSAACSKRARRPRS